MFDWQTIAVALIVAGACAYVARRGWKRLRSMRAAAGASCATGCGKCGEDLPPPRPDLIVQIGRSKPKTVQLGRTKARREP
jgi:FeoB-associated Cys-rich membrane protein